MNENEETPDAPVIDEEAGGIDCSLELRGDSLVLDGQLLHVLPVGGPDLI